MNQSNSIESTDKTNLTDEKKCWLKEISGIEDYFNQEIREGKLSSKK